MLHCMHGCQPHMLCQSATKSEINFTPKTDKPHLKRERQRLTPTAEKGVMKRAQPSVAHMPMMPNCQPIHTHYQSSESQSHPPRVGLLAPFTVLVFHSIAIISYQGTNHRTMHSCDINVMDMWDEPMSFDNEFSPLFQQLIKNCFYHIKKNFLYIIRCQYDYLIFITIVIIKRS